MIFQGSGGHLFMMVEETVGTAQGAKVSLRRNLPGGLEGPREKARAAAR